MAIEMPSFERVGTKVGEKGITFPAPASKNYAPLPVLMKKVR
jgi:hypothetical protein